MSHEHAGNAVKDQLVFEDSLMAAHHIVNSQGIPEQACHTAMALTPERMLLLGSQGRHSDFIQQLLCPVDVCQPDETSFFC